MDPIEPDPQQRSKLKKREKSGTHFLVTARFHLKPGTKVWLKIGREIP
jgi:hypothetical protein